MGAVRSVVHAFASLRFASVLLMTALVAMAYATFYETSHGLDLARRAVYESRWFQLILMLIAVNMTLAGIVRYPFTKRRIGFVVTHASILLVLCGAVVTGLCGVRGQLTLLEGESSHWFISEEQTLVLRDLEAKRQRSVRLNLGAAAPVDNPRVPGPAFDGVTVKVLRFLPDTVLSQEVVNDGPHARLALQVALVRFGREDVEWVFDDRPTRVGPLLIETRRVADRNELNEILASASTAGTNADAYLDVTIGEESFRINLMENLGKTAPIGDGELQLEIAHYLPHAQVDSGQLRSASDRPVNPAAVVYVIRGEQRQRRICFALHPDFTHHPAQELQDVKVRLSGIRVASNESDVQLLVLPDRSLHVLFTPARGDVADGAVALGSAVETPWPNTTLTVRQRFDHARVKQRVEPMVPPRETAWPALELELAKGDARGVVSVRKYTPTSMRLAGKTYQLRFENERRDLGFELTLDKFTVGRYPGTMKPRSFESQVKIADDGTGQTLGGVISMNAPLKHGGYSLFQSGYREAREGTSSTFSVARDPGMWIVFTGYVSAIVGMIVVLITRISIHRQTQALRNE